MDEEQDVNNFFLLQNNSDADSYKQDYNSNNIGVSCGDTGASTFNIWLDHDSVCVGIIVGASKARGVELTPACGTGVVAILRRAKNECHEKNYLNGHTF